LTQDLDRTDDQLLAPGHEVIRGHQHERAPQTPKIRIVVRVEAGQVQQAEKVTPLDP
jgi:hypothetical protein